MFHGRLICLIVTRLRASLIDPFGHIRLSRSTLLCTMRREEVKRWKWQVAVLKEIYHGNGQRWPAKYSTWLNIWKLFAEDFPLFTISISDLDSGRPTFIDFQPTRCSFSRCLSDEVFEISVLVCSANKCWLLPRGNMAQHSNPFDPLEIICCKATSLRFCGIIRS